MPQLDVFAFAPQVFWLILVFFVLYFSLLRTGLTNLYKILIFRKKLILGLHSDVSSDIREIFILRSTFFRFLSNFASTRSIQESVFKLSDAVLARKVYQSLFIDLIRQNLSRRSLSLKTLAVRQWLTPIALKDSSAARVTQTRKN